ncbi:MAG TPA: DUF4292 domain-containing protein [bacterium]|nr:DUF4292 domain-containing protein [bacterium]
MIIMKRLLACACVAALAGCAAPHKKDLITEAPPAPLKQMEYAEALAVINAQADQVRSLKSDIQIEVKSNLMHESEFCNGKVMLSRPDRLRVKGYRPFVPTIFDIASDGKRFWVLIPKERKLYTGVYVPGAANPVVLDIDPVSLVNAMTFEGAGKKGTAEAIAIERSGDACMVTISKKQKIAGKLRFVLDRKVFIDLETRHIVRQQYFKNDGEVSYEVSYGKYTTIDTILYPQEIVFLRPKTGTRVRINFLKTSFNQDHSSDIFTLEGIPDVDRVEVGK